MADLDPVSWPPDPLRTERLVLREPEARDRPAVLALFSSPEVGRHIGGHRPLDELDRVVPAQPTRRPGLLVIECDGAMIGAVTLDRRDQESSEHGCPVAAEVELGYLLLPEAWGRGYAVEACTALLAWFERVHLGEPVSLTTRTANTASMRVAAKLGFVEVARFEAYGAEQWLGLWSPQADWLTV